MIDEQAPPKIRTPRKFTEERFNNFAVQHGCVGDPSKRTLWESVTLVLLWDIENEIAKCNRKLERGITKYNKRLKGFTKGNNG